jgi:hypothetical protein
MLVVKFYGLKIIRVQQNYNVFNLAPVLVIKGCFIPMERNHNNNYLAAKASKLFHGQQKILKATICSFQELSLNTCALKILKPVTCVFQWLNPTFLWV